MENPFEKISERLSVIESCLLRIDKHENQIPVIGTHEAPDRYLNGEEAKKLLGNVSNVTLWEWRNKNIITGYRIGNKVMYKYSELMKCGKRIEGK